MKKMSSKMKGFICNLLLMIVLCTENGRAAADQCEASSVGTYFVFGIMGCYYEPGGTNINLHITTTTQQIPAHVRVTAPFINFNRSYTVSNHIVIPLKSTLFQYEAGKQFKGIEVNSDVNISLTIVTGNGDLMEGFLALPVSALGTRYIAASYYPYGSYSSEILVAGVESNTDVILSTMLDGHMGSNITFGLQKFETYQFKSSSDVSGSVITSNKPVAVLSGSSAAQVPVSIGGVQYLIEQMTPAKYWTTIFIIPPVYPRLHFILKIFADQDNAEVHLYNSTRHFREYMNKRSIVELLFQTDPVVVISDKPVSVVQYGHDGDDDGISWDPFMLTYQGILQFVNSYSFFTQTFYSNNANTIAITILKNDTNGLLLNEHSMSYWNAKTFTVVSPMDEYVILFVNVSYNSFYHLHHSGGKTFGAVIFGYYAFGYPLLLSFTDTECAHQVPTLTTPPSTTPAHTQITKHTNSPNLTSSAVGRWCFKCDGMTHIQYCNEVVRCQNENEVCYVQSYTKNLHVQLYRSGCVNTERCGNGDGNGGCLECCNGNFCNSAGCGDSGLPAPGNRGPLCFDCTHIGQDETCTTVQLCHHDQVCMIEKHEWGDNNFQQVMGCSQALVCTNNRSLRRMDARSAPVCEHCCHSDFCNMNCTSDYLSPPIVGSHCV